MHASPAVLQAAQHAGMAAADTAGDLLFPDAMACSFDGSGDQLAVMYSDRSLFVWDVHNLAKV